MKYFCIFLFAVRSLLCVAQIPIPSSGTIRHFKDFSSRYVQARTVDVWLPEQYDTTKRYAVLYMHDGQMLFDSSFNWNHQEWMADETMTLLLRKKKVRNCIIVGIWNNGSYRHAEYFPQKPIAYLPQEVQDSLIQLELKGKPLADEYLLFITQELKPFIDRSFATLTDRKNTFIAGSSMGGLISLYAICEYPDVFGGAACLSTHWIGSLRQKNDLIPQAFNRYVSEHLPAPKSHRIYFDYGTATLDSYYAPWQALIDRAMQARGFKSKQWITREFAGEDHSEKAWSRRLDVPLVFLLGEK